MIWWIIIGSGLIVFSSRYLFLEPRLPLRLGKKAQRLLVYSSPAVMTAIIGPIIFLPEKSLDISLSNAYLLAAIVTLIIAWKIKQALAVTLLGTSAFFLLRYFL